MLRFAKVFPLAPIALVFALGAAPGQKSATVETVQPTTSQPSAISPIAPQESELDLTAPLVPVAKPEAAASSATYEIDWYSVNGGGTVNASSANYKMGASIGQSVAGAASSASYQMGIGFWYGAGGSGGCACDCHNDPVCDAVISNVQDVVATIGVAFRGAAAIGDPNGACPFETTDMNCDGVTSVIDVVKVVNVAFRGANPATEYCVACP